MMMPHTTGTMNGQTIWKHQATSSATKPMRMAASTALLTNILSLTGSGKVVTPKSLAASCGHRVVYGYEKAGAPPPPFRARGYLQQAPLARRGGDVDREPVCPSISTSR